MERWDELIDWGTRAASEGTFFIDQLKERAKLKVLDVAAGTGFHSVQLLNAGFDVTSADGNADMLVKAFENGKNVDLVFRQCIRTFLFILLTRHTPISSRNQRILMPVASSSLQVLPWAGYFSIGVALKIVQCSIPNRTCRFKKPGVNYRLTE